MILYYTLDTTIGLLSILSVLCCVGLYYSVRNTIKKNQRYKFHNNNIPTEASSSINIANHHHSSSGITTILQTRRSPDDTTNAKERAVRTQAFLYAGTYWCSFIWMLIATIGGLFSINNVETPDQTEPESSITLDILVVLIYFFYPLQGFLNFLVYTRPRYLEYRKSEPEQGKLLCHSNVFHVTTG
jgi:hypothetical protein